MSTVGTSAALGSLVDLDVLDNKVASVETLGVGVGLGVLEEVDEELSRLDGPAATSDTPLLSWNPVSIILAKYHSLSGSQYPVQNLPNSRLPKTLAVIRPLTTSCRIS